MEYHQRRMPDDQYQCLLRDIKIQGEDVDSQQEERARMVIGPQLRFDLANGFPIISERDLVSPQPKSTRSVFTMALAELAAFLGGAQTQTELESYGCPWWKRWLTPEKCAKRGLAPGDMGPGAYGAVWRRFPTSEGKPFDQITHVIEQIRQIPHLRTHFVSPWAPQYTGRGTDAAGNAKIQKVVVVPCHGWLHFFVYPRTGMLSLHHIQRSGDVPVGIVGNIIQYAALTLMVAQVTGYVADKLIFTISDAHIYHKQFPDVNELMETKPMPFPVVSLDPTVTDLFAFRPEHFSVSDYHPQLPPRQIWTPV